jgi:hypothetical protein
MYLDSTTTTQETSRGQHRIAIIKTQTMGNFVGKSPGFFNKLTNVKGEKEKNCGMYRFKETNRYILQHTQLHFMDIQF